MNRFNTTLLFLMMVLTGMARGGGKSQPGMAALIEKNMQFAASQYKLLAQNVPADKMPKYCKFFFFLK